MEKVVIGVSGVMMSRGIAQFGLGELAKKRFINDTEPVDPMKIADHWQMHPWQAMQILNTIFLEVENLIPGSEAEISGRSVWTFEKIRVVEDPHFPEDQIELRDKDENVLVQFRNVGSLKHEFR
ncbi:MAG TPA: hypothetical protein VF772_17530 [Terriglobales bacterium]